MASISVEELFDSRSLQVDGSTTKGSRIFLVTVNDGQTSYDALHAPGVPSVAKDGVPGDVYPGLPGCVADSKSVSRLTPDCYIVNVLYSTNNSFVSGAKTNPKDLNYRTYNFNVGFENVNIPYHKKTKIEFISNSTGGETERISWEPYNVPVKLTVTGLVVTCNFKFLTYEKINIVERAAGTLHRFVDGSIWRFLGGNTSYIDKDLHQITYQWSRRQPFKGLKLPNTNDWSSFTGSLGSNEIITTDIPVNNTVKPTYTVVKVLEEGNNAELDAWRYLPGNPLQV